MHVYIDLNFFFIPETRFSTFNRILSFYVNTHKKIIIIIITANVSDFLVKKSIHTHTERQKKKKKKNRYLILITPKNKRETKTTCA